MKDNYSEDRIKENELVKEITQTDQIKEISQSWLEKEIKFLLSNNEVDKVLEKDFISLLLEAKRNTVSFALNSNFSKHDLIYEIVGIEFSKDRIVEQHGSCGYEVYEFAKNLFQGKLGSIICDSSATPLISFELLVALLEQKSIPSYMDFDNMQFYYNINQKESLEYILSRIQQ